MGANLCVGIDICDEAIVEARERAKKCKIDCEFFIRSDVYDISEELNNFFDIAHLTAGCIGWIPDISEFFRITFHTIWFNDIGRIFIRKAVSFMAILPVEDFVT